MGLREKFVLGGGQGKGDIIVYNGKDNTHKYSPKHTKASDY